MERIVTDKRCSKRGEVKPVSDFPKTGRRCKKCLYLYIAEWQKANPEKALERSRRYEARHPERAKEKSRKRYHSDPIGVGEQIKQWRRENPEKVKASTASWWARNPEKRSQYNREFRERYPEKIRVHNENRRARERNAKGKFTYGEWLQLVEKYGRVCLCCKRSDVKLTADHVIPLSVGGDNSIGNIQPLCGRCNSKKANKVIDFR